MLGVQCPSESWDPRVRRSLLSCKAKSQRWRLKVQQWSVGRAGLAAAASPPPLSTQCWAWQAVLQSHGHCRGLVSLDTGGPCCIYQESGRKKLFLVKFKAARASEELDLFERVRDGSAQGEPPKI